jgi:hypothetical protein
LFWDHPLIVTARLEQSFDDWIHQCKLWDVDVTLAVTELGFTGLSVTCILNSMLMQINFFSGLIVYTHVLTTLDVMITSDWSSKKISE